MDDDIKTVSIDTGKFSRKITPTEQPRQVRRPSGRPPPARPPPVVKEKKEITYEKSLELLEGYIPVEDIDKVAAGTHVRYFTKDKQSGKTVLRRGGFLRKKADTWVTLSNGQFSWSVQKNNARFWQKMTEEHKELEKCQEKLKRVSNKFKSLNQRNRQLESLIG